MRYEFTTYTILDSRDVLAGVCTRRVRCRGLLTPKGAVHATRRGSVQQEQGVFPAEEGSCRCAVWWRELGDLDRQETAATIHVQTVSPSTRIGAVMATLWHGTLCVLAPLSHPLTATILTTRMFPMYCTIS